MRESERAGLLFECQRCGAAPGRNCRTTGGDPVTLAEFLKARLHDEEILARAAALTWPGPWIAGYTHGVAAVPGAAPRPWEEDDWLVYSERVDIAHEVTPAGDELGDTGMRRVVAQHIAAHHPARVLADVQARRRMVRELGPLADLTTDMIMGADSPSYLIAQRDHAQWVLKLFAGLYADHPDYLEEWRP